MSKVNIGITCIGYECLEHIDRTLAPWLALRNGEATSEYVNSVHISISHGCFEETAQLGYPIASTDGTIEKFMSLKDKKLIDNLFIHGTPQREFDMWTENFVRLRDEIDLLVLLPIDEIWTVEQIDKALMFIQMNPLVDYFKVNFKNYCIDEQTWVDDFIVPRFWWTHKNQGLKGFYKDDLVEYNDGRKDVQCSHMVIPNHIVFPRHLSWVGSKEYLQRKLKFQAIRYGLCSYAWDEENDCLKLNEEFYQKMNKPKPFLHHD